MASKININYFDHVYDRNVDFDVYSTRQLKKELIKLRDSRYSISGYKVTVTPVYTNSPLSKKDWREFDRIRDIVGAERIMLKHFEGVHYEFVNPKIV